MNKKFFCLTVHSFIRIYDHCGFIVNKRSGHERIYDDVGTVFLRYIKRQPQKFEDVISVISSEFIDADDDEIRNDFYEFILDLSKDGFVITGSSENDIAVNMPSFRYSDIRTLRTETRDDFNSSVTHFMNEMFKDSPKIMTLHMDITNRCNERCIHCFLPEERCRRDIDTSLAIDILGQAADEGVLDLTISGGECLLHKDFTRILSYARKCDFSITVLSNLTLLNDDVISVLKEANIEFIQTSIYSMNPSEHDHVTQVHGSHEATVSGIEKLIDANIPVHVNFPVLKETYKSYGEVCEWAANRRIKLSTDLMITARTDNTTDNLNLRLSSEEIKEFLSHTVSYVSGSQEEINEDDPVCSVGRRAICVAQNGGYYPCAGFQNYVIGNAYKQSLHDVWNNSPELRKLRGITWNNLPECLRCEAQKFCSVCVLRNLNNTGNLFTIDSHFCKAAHQCELLRSNIRVKKWRRHPDSNWG